MGNYRKSGVRYPAASTWEKKSTRAQVAGASNKRTDQPTTNEKFVPSFLNPNNSNIIKEATGALKIKQYVSQKDTMHLDPTRFQHRRPASPTLRLQQVSAEALSNLKDIVNVQKQELLAQSDWSGIGSLKRSAISQDHKPSPKRFPPTALQESRGSRPKEARVKPSTPERSKETTIQIGDKLYLWSSTNNSVRTKYEENRITSSGSHKKRRKISQTPSSVSRGLSISTSDSPRVNLHKAKTTNTVTPSEPLNAVFRTPERFYYPKPRSSFIARQDMSTSSEVSSSVVGQASQPTSPISVSDYENSHWRQWLQSINLLVYKNMTTKSATACLNETASPPLQPCLGGPYYRGTDTGLLVALRNTQSDKKQRSKQGRQPVMEEEGVDLGDSFANGGCSSARPVNGEALGQAIAPTNKNSNPTRIKSKETAMSEAERRPPSARCDVTLFGAEGEPTTTTNTPILEVHSTCTDSPATLTPPPMLPQVSSADRQPLDGELNLRDTTTGNTLSAIDDDREEDAGGTRRKVAQNSPRRDKGPNETSFRFRQPQPFMGRLAGSLMAGEDIRNKITRKSLCGGGRAERSTAAACGKVNIRLVPNFDGDPIDDEA